MKRSHFAGLCAAMLMLVGGLVFIYTPRAQADAGDENRIFINSAAVPGGNGTRERPYVGMNEVLNELKTPGNTKYEIWITGTFRPVSLDPEVSGTPEQPIVFMQWPDMPAAIFDAKDQPGSSAFSTNGANDIIIRGLTGQNGTGNPGGLGFFVNSSRGVTLENSTAINNVESGVCTIGSTDVILRNNHFINNIGGGILVPLNTNTLIEGNIIETSAVTEGTTAIFVNDGQSVTVQKNIVKNNFHGGIRFNNTVDAIVLENIVYGNAGVGIQVGGISGEVTVVNNTVLNHPQVGIDVRTSGVALTRTNIAGNVSANNADGMAVTVANISGSTVNVANNSLLDNGAIGMKVSHQSDQQVRLLNNIIKGHAIGAQIIRGDPNFFISDYNALYDNDEPIQYAKNPIAPWKYIDDWMLEGFDTHSMRFNPRLTDEQTCFDDICVAYHLDRKSPLIDAGKVFGGRLSSDVDGDARTVDRIDIGADEFRLIHPTMGNVRLQHR